MNKDIFVSNKLNEKLAKKKIRTKVLIIEEDKTMGSIWSYVFKKVDPNVNLVLVNSKVEAEKNIQLSIKHQDLFDIVLSDIYLEGTQLGVELWNRFHEELEGRFIMTSNISFQQYQDQIKKISNQEGLFFCLNQ